MADVLSIQTAVNVTEGLKVKVSYYFIPAIILAIAALLLIMTIKKSERKLKIGERICLCICGIFIIMRVANTQYVENMYIGDINQSYEYHRTPLTILKMVQNAKVKKPDGYRKEEIEAILAPYQEKAEKESQKRNIQDKPNIIAIMNESFVDMNKTYKIDCQDVIPYIRQILQLENVTSGTMYSSVFAGGTANVEYEFLTQNTTAFLPVGAIPYQQYVQQGRENLAQTLKQLGYQTSAIHPWYRSGYSRQKIYTLFGFDTYKFYEDMSDLELITKGSYPIDRATYEEVLKQLREKEEGKPFFNFTITMQNHMPYNKQYKNRPNFIKDPQLNSYLQLINQSDEALKYLIKELEKEKEKVVLLFFGDHQPQIDILHNEVQKKKSYEVPYFIWTNYDIEAEKDKNISTNYLQYMLMETAGLPKTGYMQYMKEMQEKIPILSKNFYQDSKRNHLFNARYKFGRLCKNSRIF